MRFKIYRRRVFLIMTALLILLCVEAASADASVLLPVRRPVVKLTIGGKQIVLPVARRLASAEIKKPKKRSSLSLDGQVFNRIGGGKRLSKEDAVRYA
ncbi:MAG: hypothetical protein KAS59_07455, partial [Alphaproteobacteria bacterium]|nr:hypothetical protein [Alphaproteobacteria bacterium]